MKVRSYWIRGRPSPESGVLMRRPREDPQGSRPRDHRGRDRNDVSISINQGTPRILAAPLLKAGRDKEGSIPRVSGGTGVMPTP